jgi:hypothetical protein
MQTSSHPHAVPLTLTLTLTLALTHSGVAIVRMALPSCHLATAELVICTHRCTACRSRVVDIDPA